VAPASSIRPCSQCFRAQALAGGHERGKALGFGDKPVRPFSRLADDQHSPDRPVQVAAQFFHGPLQDLFEVFALQGRRGQVAQHAHQRIAALQLQAVLQLFQVKPLDPLELSQQRAGHRVERGHQVPHLVGAASHRMTV